MGKRLGMKEGEEGRQKAEHEMGVYFGVVLSSVKHAARCCVLIWHGDILVLGR